MQDWVELDETGCVLTATGKVNTPTFSGCPLESEFFPGMCTFCKVQIDKVLVGNPRFICHGFKIADSVFVEAESHLFLHMFCIWVPYGI